MDPLLIIVIVVIAIGIFLIVGKSKKNNAPARVEPVTPAATPTVAPAVTQTVTPTITQAVTSTVTQTVATTAPEVANTPNDPWISHPAQPVQPVQPDFGPTTGSPVPTIVISAMPSGGYGNWQSFRFDNPFDPWKTAFNILANKDPLTAFQWGLSAGNPRSNELKGEIDKWFFGSAMNPATGNSWGTSLGNKIIDLMGGDRGANTRATLGINENWYPIDTNVIYKWLPKSPKTWTQTDDQYAQTVGIPPEKWDTPAMLEYFK